MFCGFVVGSNSSSNKNFSDYQRKVVASTFSKSIDAIICFNVFIEVFIRYHLMCEYKPVILSLFIILLAVILLLLLYLLTEKIRLWGIDQVNQILCQTMNFFDLFNQQSRDTRHPSQLNGENNRVRHIVCRRDPPPLELNLPLIDFGVINFLWISARSLSREQWYYGLIELGVNFLKILEVGF